MSESQKSKKSYEDHPLARAILREGLKIQDRFSAEPIYAKTGKGYLKSAGVSEIADARKVEKAEKAGRIATP